MNMKNDVFTRRALEEFELDENLNEKNTVDEYLKVKKVITCNFGERVWLIADVCLSVVATLLLEDISNPTGLNLIDSPSTDKTTILSWFYDVDDITYKTDNFTPASFVSHSSNVKEKDLSKIDLLPRIKHKCIIVPELAPVFQKRKEDLIENISILTRVFDGQGLETDSGVRGRRGYKGDYLFAWLGASTPLDFRVWNAMGKLGSRLLFLTVSQDSSNQERLRKALSGISSEKSYKVKVNECRVAVHDFLRFLWKITGGVRMVKWNKSGDSKDLHEQIANLANLVSRARSVVSVWREKDSDYNYNQPTIEHPMRLAQILYNLARGHAIIQGHCQINEDDLAVVIQVGLSSMPDDRRQVLDLLLNTAPGEEIETGDITGALSVSEPTARAIMKTLSVLGIVDLENPGMGESYKIRLKEDFSWFQSEDFRDIRELNWRVSS